MSLRRRTMPEAIPEGDAVFVSLKEIASSEQAHTLLAMTLATYHALLLLYR